MYVEIAFPISSYKIFSYKVPSKLRDQIKLGIRVSAPFNKRIITGIVVNVSNSNKYKGKTYSIDDIIDDNIRLSNNLFLLLKWVSKYYVAPMGKVLQVALPKNLTSSYKPKKIVEVSYRNNGDGVLKNSPAKIKALNFIKQQKTPVLINSLKEIVSNPSLVCKDLLKKGLIYWNEKILEPDINIYTVPPIKKNINFTDEQNDVLKKLKKTLSLNKFAPFLLHGVTSSGKTEIYIDIVRDNLKKGKSAIILLPEIVLTPQIAGRFRAEFGDTVGIWHSKLNNSMRSWTWNKICSGHYKIIIGARSAIFAPTKDLGIIIIDEEQENSYKQDSSTPRYHARDVALMRAKINKIPILLSSATPSIESYFNHLRLKYSYLQLKNRFGGAKYPKVNIVDMSSEKDETGRPGQILSGMLLNKMEETLNKKEQIILMQNRRGFSPIISCGDCGQLEMCKRCNVPLAYHRKGPPLKCHFCGFNLDRVSPNCKKCKSSNVLMLGTGTQKIEDIVRNTFPSSSLTRIDMDTSRSAVNLKNSISEFANGEIDILLGTQMIAKGLDFENATLVGIINADTGLFLPDFRSGERLFQLIYQTSGRSGRRKKPGEVIIQTYNPDNPVIKYASSLDIGSYYKMILEERKSLNYPPYSWLAKIEFSGKDKNHLNKIIAKAYNYLNSPYKGLEILGPVDCYYEKLRNKFRMQIVLKSYKSVDPNGDKLNKYINENLCNWNTMKYPNTKISIDINPATLL
tara:strand:- start:1119 stop:3338 length:2220 start_codon:yes stop_codon:yes gene_type:complete